MNLNSYHSRSKSFIIQLLFFLPTATAYACPTHANQTLASALQFPEWLSLKIDHRIRYETLDEQFRAGGKGDDQILVFRTNILTEIYSYNWTFGFEAMDSRQAHADSGTPLNTGMVNPLDILQLYAQWKTSNLFNDNATGSIKVGRFTMDIGSRRFVARNRFRNTINAFTGIDANWKHANGNSARAFFTLPVQRRPGDFEHLLDNRSKGDDEDTEIKFWGLHYFTPKLTTLNWNDPVEWFYFGLEENDAHNRATENRNLHTLGFRAFRKPQSSLLDYQIEAAVQLGQSRASSSAVDRNDLVHFAYFYRAELGYSYTHPWNYRLSAQFDYASGDKNPNDNDNERFDSLYGARRFDFGPTGIYGPFVRSNLISPGIRLQLRPTHSVSILLAHRGFWLAQKEDAWVAAKARDPAGDSGRYIGQQSEIRLHWDAVPQTVRLELGAAYLFKGRFANNAPNASNEGDPNYWYSQLNFSF